MKFNRLSERTLDIIGGILVLLLLCFLFYPMLTNEPYENELENEVNRLENELIDKEWKIKDLEKQLESYRR